MRRPCHRRRATLVCALCLAFASLPGLDAHAQGRPVGERPLPAFDGYTLDGKALSISRYIGKRLVLFFFNPEVAEAKIVAQAVRGIARARGSHNFEIVGVGVGSSRPTLKHFAEREGLDFPVLDDSNARITRRLGLQAPVSLVVVDAEGFLLFGMANFGTNLDDGSASRVEDQIREVMRLPEREPPEEHAFGERPDAPSFQAVRLDGGERFDLKSLAGRPFVLIFFLHSCPHCHDALGFLKEQLAKLPADERPALIGVSVLDRPDEVRRAIAEHGFELDEVLLDPDRRIQELYGVSGGVPDISFVDSSGRIVHRVRGWREKREPALARMVLAKIAGQRIPMLLNPKGYTGSDVCSVCHELEEESWLSTKHATAFDTLVTHGDDRKAECVGCHVVGFDQPGGYTIANAPAHLEDVGCESCHGRGGPHLSKDFVAGNDYEHVCKTCHNPTHSLGFEYASFRPNISHTAIAALTPEQRAALGRHRPGNLLPRSDYVGSDACRGCHEAEFSVWNASAHGRSLESLEADGGSEKAECLKCHTTGFGRSGGFPAAARPDDHPDLARVGCESCHGPGAAHVAEGAKKLGTIVSLGDKCDSCAIQLICGGCHDEANDPGFEFEVEEKIDRQRHGTIEAGTGKPLSSSAGTPRPGQAVAHTPTPGAGSADPARPDRGR